MEGERVFLSPILRPVERAVYRVCGVDETTEQGWRGYPIAVLVLAAVAIVAGYVVLRLQDVLPLNQGGIPAMSPELAFNTSVSFETNTNWQNYSGETGATYLTQAGMLAVRNFTSAATGLAIAIALFRGLTRRSARTIGNYWVDMTRAILYILLPISIIGALVLVWQGVPQTWDPTQIVTTLEGAVQTHRASGPIASQEMDQGAGQQRRRVPQRELGAPVREPHRAHELARDLRAPALPVRADLHVRPVRRRPAPGLDDLRGDGRSSCRSAPCARCTSSTSATRCSRPRSTRPAWATWRARRSASGRALGGLFMAVDDRHQHGRRSTRWHDSAQPIAGLVPLFNMELGEITPGGIGAGMYGMLVIGAILAVFIAGLMVGRTPEYLGKKVEAFEIKMAMLVALVLGASILGFTALASGSPEGQAGPLNPGPHGFSEILYAFSSQTGNNGSAFAGLTGNTPFYNITGAPRDAHRPLRDDRPDPCPGRVDGGQAARRALARDVPDDGRPLDGAPDRRRDHRRRADVLPRPLAGPDRRAAAPERRERCPDP